MRENEAAGRNAFEEALAGNLTSDTVSSLLDGRVRESLFHEYKGEWFAKETPPPKQRAKDLRKAVSGFANSSGGVVLVGVSGGDRQHGKWAVPGIAQTESRFRSWANRSLEKLYPYLNQRLHIGTVRVRDELVGYVAVARASEVVRYTEGGQVMLYVRMDDDTCPMPESLYADLVLGRRQRAHLTVDVRLGARGLVRDPDTYQQQISISATVRNLSPVVATDVCLVYLMPTRNSNAERELPPGLREHARIARGCGVIQGHTRLVHVQGLGGDYGQSPGSPVELGKLPPYAVGTAQWSSTLPPFSGRSLGWKAALVITSNSTLPTQWEHSARITPALRTQVEQQTKQVDQAIISWKASD